MAAHRPYKPVANRQYPPSGSKPAQLSAACGCAGVFVAAAALQTYVQVFDEEAALDRFETFAALHGPRFYGVAPNKGTLTLHRKPGVPVASVIVGEEDVVVFCGGETLPWSIREVRP